MQTVRYGANNSWIQKTVSGGGNCTNAFFGMDPIVNQLKQCDVLTSGAPSPSPAPAPAPSPAPAPAPTVGSTCNLPNFQSALVARVNQFRTSGVSCGSAGNFGPAPALAWNNMLTLAAERHSQDMVNKAFFSHTGSDGSNGGQRITEAGYIWNAWGENIAAGQATVNQVVADWIGSPSHCANLMDPDFVDIGAVCVPGNSSTGFSTYWTMNLGRKR